MIWDGLRPDFVRPALTPNLCKLGDGGIVFSRHHAVFPSETRVNASSVATGCYPGTHGVVGNRFYIPELGDINTGDHEDLQTVAHHEFLLSKPTLAEHLKQAGLSYAIVSSGSPGSSWVQCAPGTGTMINVRDVVHPTDLAKQLHAKYGTFPPEGFPSTERNNLVTQIILEELLPQSFDVIFAWFCDPDFTQHKAGLGAELSLRSIRENDSRLGTILEAAQEINADVMVGSDHGFSTLTQPSDYKSELIQRGIDINNLIWRGNSITIKNNSQVVLEKIVAFLQEQNWVGPIFTHSESKQVEGHISGTFSFRTINLDHARTPAILYSKSWTDQTNEYDISGTVIGSSGTASHGTCSPYDMHNVLIAGGPSFKSGIVSDIASGNVDIAPTVYHLITGNTLSDVDGRVLTEAIASGKTPADIQTQTLETGNEKLQQFLEIASVSGTEYINKGWSK
jgi:predicted AlkP superfamily pyrophosphatase or phosphodiesterase